jgi:hypothetical protein
MDENRVTLAQKTELCKELEQYRKGIIQAKKDAENSASTCLMFVIGIVVGVSGSIFANSVLNILKSYHIVDALAAIVSLVVLAFFGILFYRQYKLNSMDADFFEYLLNYGRQLPSEIQKEIESLNKKK